MGRPQPALSSMGAPPPEADPGGGPGGGGLAKLVFSLEQAVKTLAKAVPTAAEEIGQISQLLRAVLMKASQTGANQGREAAQPPGGFAAKPVV